MICASAEPQAARVSLGTGNHVIEMEVVFAAAAQDRQLSRQLRSFLPFFGTRSSAGKRLLRDKSIHSV
jgi:hypothetical protein